MSEELSEQMSEVLPDDEALRARISELEAELASARTENERARKERAEFLKIFPSVDPDILPDGVAEMRERGVPLAAAYALYERIRQNELDAALAASKRAASSLPQKLQAGGEVFFSAEEVKSMSSRQVRDNFKSILRSMKHWSK